MMRGNVGTAFMATITVCAVLALGAAELNAGAAAKVDICHVNGQGEYRLIRVSENALRAHMRHGDRLPAEYFLDGDGDGFGTDDTSEMACVQPDGYAEIGGDCDDSDADAYPGAEEACDGADNDCDGFVDEDACGCGPCETSDDCSSGICHDFICQPSTFDGVQSIQLEDGSSIEAYVGCDDRVLLAHYGAAGRISYYDQEAAQVSGLNGGGPAPSGFFPTLLSSGYGHLDMSGFSPTGKEVRMECASEPGGVVYSVASSSLFDSFASGTKGTYGDVGEPGWGYSAAYASGLGRSSHAACGAAVGYGAGGISYCSGTGGSYYWGNHLVSYYSTTMGDSPYLGCNGTGQNGDGSTIEVWIWIEQ